jgi:HEAT repeat protein
MRVDRGVISVGLAVVLLVTACAGKISVAYEQLRDSDPAVRSQGAIRLGQTRSKVRCLAAHSIARLAPEDAAARAALALGALGGSSDLPILDKALSDKKGLVRNRAAEAIDKIKDAKSS